MFVCSSDFLKFSVMDIIHYSKAFLNSGSGHLYWIHFIKQQLAANKILTTMATTEINFLSGHLNLYLVQQLGFWNNNDCYDNDSVQVFRYKLNSKSPAAEQGRD